MFCRRTNDKDREEVDGGDNGSKDDGEEGPSRTWREKGKWKKRDVRAVNAAEPDGDDRYGLASLEYEDIFEDLDVTLELTEYVVGEGGNGRTIPRKTLPSAGERGTCFIEDRCELHENYRYMFGCSA